MQVMNHLPLHQEHASLGAHFEDRAGTAVVASYGDPQAEYRLLVRAVGVADLSDRGLLRVVGREAAEYLHGMVTNDVKGLRPGQGNLSTIVHARGRMLGDCRVFRLGEEEIWIDLPAEARAGVLAHLDQYLVSEACEIQDVGAYAVHLGAWGPEARAVVEAALGGEPPALGVHENRFVDAPGGRVLLVGSRLFGPEGYEIYFAPEAAAEAWTRMVERARALGGGPVGDRALDAARIEAGIPRWGRELLEDTIPIEANLREAISYTKGCYVGQEVIAKATYRGAVRRHLVRLEVSAGAVPGALLREEDRPVGQLTSVLDPHPGGGPPVALGYVKRDRLEVGREFAIESGGRARILWVPEKEA